MSVFRWFPGSGGNTGGPLSRSARSNAGQRTVPGTARSRRRTVVNVGSRRACGEQVLLLALTMGLGGGIVRDVLLGLRPAAITSSYYLPTAVAAALVGFLFTSLVRRFKAAFTLLDVLSEGLFTVIGVEKALNYHLPYASAIFLGVITAVGGGLLTDLAAGRPVQVVRGDPGTPPRPSSAPAYTRLPRAPTLPLGSAKPPRSPWSSSCAWPRCAGPRRPRCPPTRLKRRHANLTTPMKTRRRTGEGGERLRPRLDTLVPRSPSSASRNRR